MSPFLRSSKADQYNDGCLLNHHRADVAFADLCPVRNLWSLFECFPERAHEERDLPTFRWADGSAATRDQIHRLLQRAGLPLGIPGDATGMHSLRSGGASAIYNATGGNVPLVRRLGRWASDAFEGYIWEDSQLTRGLASRMLNAPWSVHSATSAPEIAQRE